MKGVIVSKFSSKDHFLHGGLTNEKKPIVKPRNRKILATCLKKIKGNICIYKF